MYSCERIEIKMIVDMLGKTRIKVGLHVHTNRSDGRLSPAQAAKAYREQGYDAVAFTDHWQYGEECEIEGIKILSGAEYDIGGHDSKHGVYHIIGIGMTSDPEIPLDWKNMKKTTMQKSIETIKRIKMRNGYAMIGHPAWSLNTPEQLISLGDYDGIEIYNAVSEWGESDRPYSGVIIDCLANLDKIVPLTATDDTHYYEYDFARAFVMVEAVDIDSQSIVRALKAGRFYASQGPEIHLIKTAPDKVKLICSPVCKIALFSNLVWAANHKYSGEGLVEIEYTRQPHERFIRAEITDEDGNKAWSNIITFEDFDD